MREIYYYVRNKERKPLVTVCLLFSPSEDKIYRGVAVCSPKDNPNKAIGRGIAKGRALRARKYHRVAPEIPMPRNHRPDGYRIYADTVSRIEAWGVWEEVFADDSFPILRAKVAAVSVEGLSDYERKIIEAINRGE